MERVEFFVSAEDLGALAGHNAAIMDGYRSTRWRSTLLPSFALMVFVTTSLAINMRSMSELLVHLITPSLIAGLLGWFFWMRYPRMLANGTKLIVNEKSAPMMLGPQSLQVHADGICVENAHSTLHVRWSAIPNIVDTDDHIMVSFGTISGVPINKGTLKGASPAHVLNALQTARPKDP